MSAARGVRRGTGRVVICVQPGAPRTCCIGRARRPSPTVILSAIVPDWSALAAPAEASDEGARTARIEQIFHRHLDAVWRTARSLGVVPRDLEDVVQEVMIVCVRRLADIDPARERPFLLATTVKLVANWRRGRRRRPAEPVASVEEVEAHALDRRVGHDSPVEALERKRGLELVQAALEQMTEPQRGTFTLFEIEGLTAREIAEQLGVSEAVVFARLQRARGVFHRYIAHHSVADRPVAHQPVAGTKGPGARGPA
jgi:RNA polymerase sigma-70 factor, ECF subfamily